ncbi:MAG: folylpolyglutamate synthase/dihydrofolate synthase family protein, partial [Phycisphaerae bacterium]
MTRTATRQAGKPDVKRTKTTKTTRPAPKKAERAAPSKSSAIKTYKAAIAHLNSLVDYEKMLRLQYNEDRFDLRKMQKLLHGLGNPHKQLKVLHVAGTKGKGSTCHMLAAMLKKAGHTVGLYTSPHIMDVRERIRINGEMISESAFTKYADTISKVTLGADSPTYYEFMTAMAMLCFAEKNLDYVVLETGMGGRLDATNVVTPVVCGITNISYDHMAQLGNTLDKIATEKAGIFKPGVTVISAPQSSAAEKALNKVAEKVGCNIRVLGKDVEFSYRFESSRATGPHTRICMATAGTRFDHL